MQLRIEKIHLKNFKAFKEITFYPNRNFNIIIGENSVGKSSLFEAIHLWEKCYKTYILASRKGFYKVKKTTNRYVNYQELDFLRITQDDDLFFDPQDPELKKCSEITITLINDEGKTWSLGFKITCPTSIENAFYRVQPIDGDSFEQFSNDFCQHGQFLDEAIFIYQTKPISGVHQYEPYYNQAQIKRRIQKSSSHEVLRNKIISKRKSIIQLEQSISQILEKEVKFELPPVNRKDKDEYIDLKVSIDGSKPYDLHLQGSGFLQIVEILSTIEFIQAPLKLLLVDEPDSHIHVKLQRNLLEFLRNIDHNQFFVISHNDQFVSNASQGELFFLNQEIKETQELKAVPIDSFDVIKRSLGGVVIALEQLNEAQSIVFVEGESDASYIKKIYDKIREKDLLDIKNNLNSLAFFPLRGKDKLLDKIEYNKRTLSSLFKDKEFYVLYDRDYSTSSTDKFLQSGIIAKKCSPHSHQGYCIESILFSDIDILQRFISDSLSIGGEAQNFKNVDVKEILDDFYAEVKNPDSELSVETEGKFLSQRKNRTELKDLEFNDFIRELKEEDDFVKYELFMSKPMIDRFIVKLEDILGRSFVPNKCGEELSTQLFYAYCNWLSCESDLYPDFKKLFKTLKII